MAVIKEVTSQATVTHCSVQRTHTREPVQPPACMDLFSVHPLSARTVFPHSGRATLPGAQTDPAERAGGGRKDSALHYRLSRGIPPAVQVTMMGRPQSAFMRIGVLEGVHTVFLPITKSHKFYSTP